jgi:hypothetical protein
MLGAGGAGAEVPEVRKRSHAGSAGGAGREVPFPHRMPYDPMDPANEFVKRPVTYGRSVGLNGPGPGRSGGGPSPR